MYERRIRRMRAASSRYTDVVKDDNNHEIDGKPGQQHDKDNHVHNHENEHARWGRTKDHGHESDIEHSAATAVAVVVAKLHATHQKHTIAAGHDIHISNAIIQ